MGWRVIWVVALGVAGCASSGPGGNMSKPPEAGSERERLVAEAGGTRFPRDLEASDELKVTAVVDREDRTIALRNFGDAGLKDVEVWVNESYVRRVPLLPARGELVINFAQFFDARGSSLGEEAGVTRVQLRAGRKLYNVMGPAYD